MLRWLDTMGFELAPDLVLECRVDDGYQAERDDALSLPAAQTPGHETDYGAPEPFDEPDEEVLRHVVSLMNYPVRT